MLPDGEAAIALMCRATRFSGHVQNFNAFRPIVTNYEKIEKIFGVQLFGIVLPHTDVLEKNLKSQYVITLLKFSQNL